MCKQLIAIAQCAPPDPENCALTFQCGQLHHYAATRETCDDAKGDCICFFGTCGRINNIVRTQPFDLMALPKIRCLPCTGRDEQGGERRQGRDLLETKLLTHEPVDDQGMLAYAKVLKERWDGANECPYHELGESDSSETASIQSATDEKPADDYDGIHNHVAAHTERGSPEAPTTVRTADDQAAADGKSYEKAQDHKATETEACAGAADHPAPTPIKQESLSHETPTKLDHIPAFTKEEPQSPNKINEGSPQSKPMLGIETSRWAPETGGRLDTTPEPEKGPRQESMAPRSTPRRELYNTPNIEPGNSSIAHRADDIKKFLGL